MKLSTTRAAELRHCLRQLRGAMSSLSRARTRYAPNAIASTHIATCLVRLHREAGLLVSLINGVQTQGLKRGKAA